MALSEEGLDVCPDVPSPLLVNPMSENPDTGTRQKIDSGEMGLNYGFGS
jgi:hypothetical protein